MPLTAACPSFFPQLLRIVEKWTQAGGQTFNNTYYIHLNNPVGVAGRHLEKEIIPGDNGF